MLQARRLRKHVYDNHNDYALSFFLLQVRFQSAAEKTWVSWHLTSQTTNTDTPFRKLAMCVVPGVWIWLGSIPSIPVSKHFISPLTSCWVVVATLGRMLVLSVHLLQVHANRFIYMIVQQSLLIFRWPQELIQSMCIALTVSDHNILVYQICTPSTLWRLVSYWHTGSSASVAVRGKLLRSTSEKPDLSQ